jgi:hypothetical protein
MTEEKDEGFKLPIPKTSAVVAGLTGLPSVMYLVTPLRNTLTLAANNPTFTTMQCYRSAFGLGIFKGGVNMAIGGMPASVAVGPAYHAFYAMSGGSGAFACLMAGTFESAILFAPETRNAQIAFHGKTTQVRRMMMIRRRRVQ